MKEWNTATVTLGNRNEDLNLFEPKFELDNDIAEALTGRIKRFNLVLNEKLVNFIVENNLTMKITERKQGIGKERKYLPYLDYSDVMEIYFTPEQIVNKYDFIKRNEKAS